MIMVSNTWRRTSKKDHVPRTTKTYICVDGTVTNQPFRYCCRYRAYLTEDLVNLHNCKRKNCEYMKPSSWAIKRNKGVVNDEG